MKASVFWWFGYGKTLTYECLALGLAFKKNRLRQLSVRMSNPHLLFYIFTDENDLFLCVLSHLKICFIIFALTPKLGTFYLNESSDIGKLP